MEKTKKEDMQKELGWDNKTLQADEMEVVKAKKKRKVKLSADEKEAYTKLYYKTKTLPAYACPSPKFNFSSHGNFLEGLLKVYADAYSFCYVKTDVQGTYRAELRRYTPTKSTKGAPDVYIIANGRVAFVEVKGRGDSLSPEQIKLHDSIRKNGLPVFIFHGHNDLIQIHNYLKNEKQ